MLFTLKELLFLLFGILLGIILAKISKSGQSDNLFKILKYFIPVSLFLLIIWILLDFSLIERGFKINLNSKEGILQRLGLIKAFLKLIYDHFVEFARQVLQR
jgi:hypothetical protein